MIFVELGSGLRPIPIVCVRDTKVRKFLGLDGFVEKVVQVVQVHLIPLITNPPYLVVRG